MNNIGLAFDGAWKVLVAGVLLGAGLPAIFALGIRALAYGAGGDAEVDHEAGHPIGKVLAILCFALVVIGIALGITYIVATGFGKTLSFQNFYPTLVSK
ncbi:MAG: hypothetical protein IPI13_09815 [Actinomycetales bacterium]|jgi:hypothetical protein|uniref:Transmembrane protein n=1 Tax=Candidatus Phosphoribacter hodrii TaxID=2953743 RepID=A0A935IVE2_9MICO|nr:hypothetical protein [Candidatus Phosphoribacter hodrii]MBP8838464.1 hypothetical protein [Dermatophilaceae bacterium]OPZ56369.1 MAG: hypothetical protein BWY91_00418 [bacterium ADurb.BinA028]MBK7273438.1 hypothetical protein [Candidatus Phosphoribacter hodrii]MBL0005462.1 hypothetical protein [Candidatus Phosphoribacter hodrii]